MREKRHCCCCVPLPDGVMLVGIYGTAFHAGLLVIQVTHGASLAPEPEILHPPFAADIVKQLLLLAHLLGILVNLLLISGMYWGHRKLMLPWLFLQGFLASILASLACYYLALFPLKISCIGRRDANFRPYSPLATASVISSASITNTRIEEEEDTSTNSTNGSSCQPLLWYSVIMILSLLILVYYFYIVQDFLGQLKEEKKRQNTLWKIDIELREPPEQLPEDDDEVDVEMPPTEIFDDTVEPTSSSDNTKQVTFSNTTSSHEYKDTSDEQVTPPPKKTSRIVWQEHVEVLE